MWLRFTPKKAKLFTTGGSMGYIHCCGALRKTKTYRMVPQEGFLLCEIDYLSTCPVCGHTVVQLTRIDKEDKISTIRKINKKAKEFFKKLKKEILYEIRPFEYKAINIKRFYLNYNEYGVQKRCYSNISALKLGKFDKNYL